MANARQNRPLSPHLSIYKPLPTMVMSIVHRITGGALYFGTVLLAWWLISAAAGPSYFELTNAIFGSLIGRLILFLYTWALLHHMFGGIRHLIWDTGRAFDKHVSTKMAWATLICSVSLTIILWAIALISS
ncbi:succinate dehydrogenase, cytochrome b556 subunit [Hoeflea prorocentri]|uniref:Succinate dehydrogenase cytochrome b556 subunit n=1 Tax=Hoeflea prorocentri TaxID=1922333 RepID=A0A9X3UME8_9HYPH|nr:succinate dehydrogenase, cytochrome b556 subunit [Hoeflea prorocentri]MCY6383408.1 succinate dehydrogenase, cytochrome b556 subunit [Hoeflea prorocentri]MDA5401208.1 succinate dehydrogenase, cytochrome b556 subunit [Hoeflea prorocentri]